MGDDLRGVLARCLIALAALVTLADGRHDASDTAGGERVDVDRKIAILLWRSRSGTGRGLSGDGSDAASLSTYRMRPHEAQLSTEEAAARLRLWRARVAEAHDDALRLKIDECGSAPAPAHTAASDRLGAWRKWRVLAQSTAPEAVAFGGSASGSESSASVRPTMQRAAGEGVSARQERGEGMRGDEGRREKGRVVAKERDRERPPSHSSSPRWTVAEDGEDWGPVGARAGELKMSVLVCIPTMRRRNGATFVGQVLSAVREHELNSSSSIMSDAGLGVGDVQDVEDDALRAQARAGYQPASPAAARVRVGAGGSGTRGAGVGRGAEGGGGGDSAGAGSERVKTRVLVMHNEEDERPLGGDYYMTRMKHEISAPCGFMRWRRGLVLDFLDMMQAALEIMDQGLVRAASGEGGVGGGGKKGEGGGVEGVGEAEEKEGETVDYVLWLEDDALLHRGWTQMLLRSVEAGEPPACLTALHPCGCHGCNALRHYNGIGTVAILIRRERLGFIIDALLHLALRDFRPLDTVLGAICRQSFGHGGPRAWYFKPPLVTHLGDAVLGTTKPQVATHMRARTHARARTHTHTHTHTHTQVAATRIRVLRPAEGEVVKCGGPSMSFEFVAEGLVYDAEYSWRFLVGEEEGAPLQKGLKIPSPHREQECSDSPSVTLSVRLAQAVVPPGSYEVSLELLEEESDTAQVVCRTTVTFSVVDDCPMVQELAAQGETLGTHTHTRLSSRPWVAEQVDG